jgi:hypothetical protein
MTHLDPPLRILLDVPLTFAVGDDTTHAPMVVATVRGVTTRLILDTGSSDHVLTRALVDEAGLPTEPAEPGTDSTGASVPSWAVGDFAIEIDDRPFALHGAIAIAGPLPFAGWGVGGFLSPQHLHPRAWVVLDLVADRLIVVDGDAGEIGSWLAGRRTGFRLARLRRLSEDPTIMVLAALEPFDPVVTLLDSGGKSTQFVAAAVPGLRPGSATSAGHGVSGRQIVGAAVTDQTLVLDGARVRVPRIIVRESMAGPAGLVGMDVLRGTILAVNADRRQPVFWQVPEPADPRREVP